MFQLGTAKLKGIANKMGNIFWKQVLISTDKFMQEAVFCSPERLFLTPFWENPLFRLNEKPVTLNTFGTLSNKLQFLYEFYNAENGQKYTRVELNRKFRVRLSDEKFGQISEIIKRSLINVGLSQNFNYRVNHPIMPGLIEIVNLVKKGTKPYYNILRKRTTLCNKVRERESKWHNLLGITYSVEMWNVRYSQCAKIRYDNNLKWFIYQINRGTQYTNYRVNKMYPHISPKCTFCDIVNHPFNSPEKIDHLYYDCDQVISLWDSIINFAASHDIFIDFHRTTLLFGDPRHSVNSQHNYLINSTKQYIWKSKFRRELPNFLGYCKYLKYKIEILIDCLKYDGRLPEIEQWAQLHSNL